MINTINIVPRYAETDKMGIVHHSVYAIWYELARTEYFNKIGLRYDEIEDKDGKHLNVGTTTLAWADAGTFKILNLKRSYPALYSKLLQLLEE